MDFWHSPVAMSVFPTRSSRQLTSLVSTDHGKLKAITTLLQPGAVFADDGQRFAVAIDAIRNSGMQVINHRNQAKGSISYDDLLDGRPEDTESHRASLDRRPRRQISVHIWLNRSPKAVINTNQMIVPCRRW